jgi:hypothetical protein
MKAFVGITVLTLLLGSITGAAGATDLWATTSVGGWFETSLAVITPQPVDMSATLVTAKKHASPDGEQTVAHRSQSRSPLLLPAESVLTMSPLPHADSNSQSNPLDGVKDLMRVPQSLDCITEISTTSTIQAKSDIELGVAGGGASASDSKKILKLSTTAGIATLFVIQGLASGFLIVRRRRWGPDSARDAKRRRRRTRSS